MTIADGYRDAGRTFAELAPEAHRAITDLEGALWLEPGLRELLAVRISHLNGCAEAAAEHARTARTLGESEERLAALGDWWESYDLFEADEAAALRLADAIALAPDGPEVVAARADAGRRFGERELAQLVYACVALNALSRLELAAGDARLPQDS